MSKYHIEYRHVSDDTWMNVSQFEHKPTLSNRFKDADKAREAIRRELDWDKNNLQVSEYKYRLMKDGEEYDSGVNGWNEDVVKLRGKIQKLIDTKYAETCANTEVSLYLQKTVHGYTGYGLEARNVQLKEDIAELKGLLK